jgi:hypothetical protein
VWGGRRTSSEAADRQAGRQDTEGRQAGRHIQQADRCMLAAKKAGSSLEDKVVTEISYRT